MVVFSIVMLVPPGVYIAIKNGTTLKICFSHLNMGDIELLS